MVGVERRCCDTAGGGGGVVVRAVLMESAVDRAEKTEDRDDERAWPWPWEVCWVG